MADHDFTAGITLADGRVLTVDVTGIDGDGIHHKPEQGADFVPWADIKAVMLATTDHMLESAGYLFSMAETVERTEQEQPYEAESMRRLGAGLLQQAAPRLCPLGDGCPLSTARQEG